MKGLRKVAQILFLPLIVLKEDKKEKKIVKPKKLLRGDNNPVAAIN